MQIRTLVSRGFISSLLVLALATLALADTIRLKDGSVIKGKIVGFVGGKFVVTVGEGARRRELKYLAADVESVKFDEPDAAPQLSVPANRTVVYNEPADKPAAAPTQKIYKKVDPVPENSSRVKEPGEGVKPIEWRVKVLADNTANGWTNTGWVVKKGQKIRISGEGRVSLGRGQSSTPSGLSSLEDNMKLLKNVPTGALVAVIGDDNNDFIYIGAEREFTATRDGALFLGINEGNIDDNSGAYDVKVEIMPDGSE